MNHPSLFVAEVSLPTIQISARENERAPLPPGYLGIAKGYWYVPGHADAAGTIRPEGVVAVVEFDADGLPAAEDRALALTDDLGGIFSFFSGSPASPGRLIRIGQVGGTGGLLAQFNYLYDVERYSTVRWQPGDLSRQLARLALLDSTTRRQAELGMRWYATSLSLPNPIDAFLAAWIGLEAVGPILNDRFHKGVGRAGCATCQHPAGKERDGKLAGIQHVLRTVAPEVNEPASKLKRYRDTIAHGLTSIESIGLQVGSILVDIQIGLGAGVLTLLAAPGAGSGALYSADLARDWSQRPDARVEARFGGELPHLRPYLGEWASVQVNEKFESTTQGDQYVRFLTPAVEFKVDLPPGWEPTALRFVRFERLGSAMTLTSDDEDFPCTVERWHDRLGTAAQVRIMASA